MHPIGRQGKRRMQSKTLCYPKYFSIISLTYLFWPLKHSTTKNTHTHNLWPISISPPPLSLSWCLYGPWICCSFWSCPLPLSSRVSSLISPQSSKVIVAADTLPTRSIRFVGGILSTCSHRKILEQSVAILTFPRTVYTEIHHKLFVPRLISPANFQHCDFLVNLTFTSTVVDRFSIPVVCVTVAKWKDCYKNVIDEWSYHLWFNVLWMTQELLFRSTPSIF